MVSPGAIRLPTLVTPMNWVTLPVALFQPNMHHRSDPQEGGGLSAPQILSRRREKVGVKEGRKGGGKKKDGREGRKKRESGEEKF